MQWNGMQSGRRAGGACEAIGPVRGNVLRPAGTWPWGIGGATATHYLSLSCPCATCCLRRLALAYGRSPAVSSLSNLCVKFMRSNWSPCINLILLLVYFHKQSRQPNQMHLLSHVGLGLLRPPSLGLMLWLLPLPQLLVHQVSFVKTDI